MEKGKLFKIDKGDWFEVPGVVGIGTVMRKHGKKVGISMAMRFRFWGGEKKYMSIEMPISPLAFADMKERFEFVKKQQEKAKICYGHDMFHCPEEDCVSSSFYVGTDHKNERTIILHLKCALCGTQTDHTLKMIPKISDLEKYHEEEKEKGQRLSEDQPAEGSP